MPYRVCIVGSGNWGSAIAKIIGRNTQRLSDVFETRVNMWVFEEQVNGRKLTEIINNDHENVKYLPGIKLPENIIAVPDLVEAAHEADILVFVVPHQFVSNLCKQLHGKIKPTTSAISLIKGVDTTNGLALVSDIIRDMLKIDVAVLMGANIAGEVAEEHFCETTIGCRSETLGPVYHSLFNAPFFRVTVVQDTVAVELCGALKNVVALGAGFVDGLSLGDNTKAAIIRIGLMEMIKLTKTFYQGVQDSTFFESCGVADLITTCYGGRNRKVAEAFVRTGKSLDQLEAELLNGQKLQGTLTAKEIHGILKEKNLLGEFPLFTTIYRICYEGLPPKNLVTDI